MPKSQFRFKIAAGVSVEGVPVVRIRMPDATDTDDRERHLSAPSAIDLAYAILMAAFQSIAGTVTRHIAQEDGFKEEGCNQRATDHMETFAQTHKILANVGRLGKANPEFDIEQYLKENMKGILTNAAKRDSSDAPGAKSQSAESGIRTGGDGRADATDTGGSSGQEGEFCDGDVEWFAATLNWSDTNKA